MTARYKNAEGVIELRPAFSWTCPQCGLDWFERAIVYEQPAGRRKGVNGHGAKTATAFVATIHGPYAVACPDCKKLFKTTKFFIERRQ